MKTESEAKQGEASRDSAPRPEHHRGIIVVVIDMSSYDRAGMRGGDVE